MIAIILGVLLISSGVFFIYFYNSLNKKYDHLIDKVGFLLDELNKPLRNGYYTKDYTQGKIYNYTAYIYVIEKDRYTNGDSKIEINNIELISDTDINKFSAKKFVLESFKSIKKTADIIWLESEQTIKEQRKNKLKQLQNNFK